MTFRGSPDSEKCNLDKNVKDTPSSSLSPQGEGARGALAELSAGEGWAEADEGDVI